MKLEDHPTVQRLHLASSMCAAVAGGAWFGSLTWPWSTAAALQRRSSI
jgi:hypothetical protein